MRNKTTLALMEQVVMILVFALSATLCVQVFVLADQKSKRNENRDRALLEAQNLAEILKSTGGSPENALIAAADYFGGTYDSMSQSVMIDYDTDWNQADNTMRYTLTANLLETEIPGLAQAEIWARDETQEEELIRFQVFWQTEGANGS